MMIAVFYLIIILLIYSVLLSVFGLGDEVLDVSVVDAKFSGYISDGDFILDGRYEL